MLVVWKVSKQAARTVDRMDVRSAVLTAGMLVGEMASLRAAVWVAKWDWETAAK